MGPGPLSCAGGLDAASLERIVSTAILEACVGETLAAVEANEAALHANDPAVRHEERPRAGQSNARAAALLAHGVLTPTLLHETRQAAIEELVALLARGLAERSLPRAA